MANRKRIPKDVEVKVLTSSARRCALCFGLAGDVAEKKGQIAHLDHDPSNPAFDNLAWLCFDHHDAYDGKTRQSKNYTLEEVKTYRDKLYTTMAMGKDESETANIYTEKHFDAGSRIKAVREELRLTTSQITELLSVKSQRDYEAMENGSKEVPLQILMQVSELTGVSLEWLKHGKLPRYKKEHIYLHSVSEAVDYCAKLNPLEYFLVLDKKNLHIGLVAQISKYFFRFMTIGGVSLDYWNWVEHRLEMIAFHEFLERLSGPWHDIEGVLFPSNVYKQLHDGEIHFFVAMRKAYHYGGDLLYDILDIDEDRRDPLFDYSKRYGGRWMHRLHETYKEFLKEVALNEEFNSEFLASCEIFKQNGIDVSYLENEFRHNQGVFTAKRIFYWNKGFEELSSMKEKRLLDRSIEALVLQKRFLSLFTKDDITEAKRRLEALGFFPKGN